MIVVQNLASRDKVSILFSLSHGSNSFRRVGMSLASS